MLSTWKSGEEHIVSLHVQSYYEEGPPPSVDLVLLVRCCVTCDKSLLHCIDFMWSCQTSSRPQLRTQALQASCYHEACTVHDFFEAFSDLSRMIYIRRFNVQSSILGLPLIVTDPVRLPCSSVLSSLNVRPLRVYFYIFLLSNCLCSYSCSLKGLLSISKRSCCIVFACWKQAAAANRALQTCRKCRISVPTRSFA